MSVKGTSNYQVMAELKRRLKVLQNRQVSDLVKLAHKYYEINNDGGYTPVNEPTENVNVYEFDDCDLDHLMYFYLDGEPQFIRITTVSQALEEGEMVDEWF